MDKLYKTDQCEESTYTLAQLLEVNVDGWDPDWTTLLQDLEVGESVFLDLIEVTRVQ